MGWTHLRVNFLAILTGILIVLVVRIQLSPDQRKLVLSSSILPEQVQLPQWQLLSTQKLPASKASNSWLDGQRYQYEYQRRPISIDMRYLVNTANGDVRIWLSHFTKIPIKLDIRQHSTSGYYGLTNGQGFAYLVACIPPYGKSTVTAHQYQLNVYAHLLQQIDLPNRLLGRSSAPWVDDRCLWTILSTPLDSQSESDIYMFLEQAWVPWHEWWVKHYPPLMSFSRGE